MASRFKVAVTLHPQSRSRAGMDANDSSCSPLSVLLDGLCVLHEEGETKPMGSETVRSLVNQHMSGVADLSGYLDPPGP